jgi:hypothetical protein
MIETPRRRAIVNAQYVEFQSRNPDLASIRWHSRFKQRYRTKSDALTAKAAWEERGKILWPQELRATTPPKPKPVTVRYREMLAQGEVRV